MKTSLHDLSAHELLAGYKARDFSPVDVTRAVLAQIERWEPHLFATYLLRPEQALAQARASEARWLKGEPRGTLDGVPATIKDNIATQGDPVPLGTRAVALTPAPADAPPAWAAAMRRRQMVTQGATIGAQTLKGGDSHGGGSAPDISEKD